MSIIATPLAYTAIVLLVCALVSAVATENASTRTEARYARLGWTFFALSALGFIAAAWVWALG